MEYNIFTSFIWKSKLIYDDKNKLIKIIQERYKKNPNQTPKGWKCSVHSSFKKENNYIPKDLIKLIHDKSSEFLSVYSKKIKLEGKYIINNIWFNAYSGDQFQEPHVHGDALFSGCYYLRFDKKNHDPTTFYNPNFNLNHLKIKNNPYFCINLDCEEDDIIFFPSFLKHGTGGLKNKTTLNNLRITISFNILNSDVCYIPYVYV